MSYATAKFRRRRPSKVTKPDPITWTIKQTQQATGLGNTKLYGLMRDGRLRSVMIDGRRLVYVSSVRALLPDG
jgi:hypothetical protein